MSPEVREGAWHKAWRCRNTRTVSEAAGDDGGGINEANSERP